MFDDFCRTSADEHARAKAERARWAREDFAALLDEAAAPGACGAPPLYQGFFTLSLVPAQVGTVSNGRPHVHACMQARSRSGA